MADVELRSLPEQAQEDALHAARLLSVEERPFQRVTKTLLAPNSLLRPSLTYLPSPPPEGEDDYESSRVERFREDVLLDFANLESSITRMQLILSSNQRERERYAAEKAKILETAQAVRDNTVELRAHLVEAQAVLERRKGYDQMATKILDDRKLKSRDDARADIEKLEKEIASLQDESAEYEVTWVSRSAQFDNIVREGEAMVRAIKGIKDEPEPEKDENMEDAEDDGEDDGEDGLKANTSRMNSPGADGRSPRPADTGNATPKVESGEGGGATPARPPNRLLDVDEATRSSSRTGSPLAQPGQMPDDVDMTEGGTAESRPSTAHGLEASADQAGTPMADVAESMDES
ncbi:hypothetical protein TI39_contig1197g00001 [Zymoseptoria brevis]|uniref:Uncharacterized protein n=1 Tax=Zymoseptoria brevis TaxID=1047168 RepID=A0A0F4GE69_9PEZI|nr:hypothetical protein TI39_contig1197g00001 [Zymoseptoria brevis]